MSNEVTERVMASPKTGQNGNGLREITERDEAYWAANLRLILICLSIWALVSYGFGILLRPLLMGINVGGADLGFWFAQQGSILTFLALVFFYSWRMNELDKKFGMED